MKKHDIYQVLILGGNSGYPLVLLSAKGGCGVPLLSWPLLREREFDMVKSKLIDFFWVENLERR